MPSFEPSFLGEPPDPRARFARTSNGMNWLGGSIHLLTIEAKGSSSEASLRVGGFAQETKSPASLRSNLVLQTDTIIITNRSLATINKTMKRLVLFFSLVLKSKATDNN